MDAILERMVWKRAGDRCEYCLIPQFADELSCHIDHIILVGRTAIGRATIATLGINLPHRVELRETLIDEGVFQP